jgi:hypothetical protein
MDRKVAAAAAHVDGEEEAAERAGFNRMRLDRARLLSIQDQRHALTLEEIALRKSLAGYLGVAVGDVVDGIAGKRLKVLEIEGDFNYSAGQWVPCVRCWCAPETKTGFHPKNKVRHTIHMPDLALSATVDMKGA